MIRVLAPFYYSYLYGRICARRDQIKTRTILKSYLDLDFSDYINRLGKIRGNAEDLISIKKNLYKRMTDECRLIALKAPEHSRPASQAYLDQYRVSDMKTVLRYLKKDPDHDHSPLLIFDDIASCGKSVNDVISLEPFYNYPTFCRLMKDFNSYSISQLEKALDLDYFNFLHAVIQSYRGIEKKKLLYFAGYFIDMSNILNFLRLKFTYRYNDQEIISSIFSSVSFPMSMFHLLMKKETLLQAVNLLSTVEGYGFLKDSDSIEEIEMRMIREKFRRADKFLSGAEFNIGLVFSWFWLLESEYYFSEILAESKALGHPEAAEEFF